MAAGPRERILRRMNRARVLAALPWAAFALLGALHGRVGGVPGLRWLGNRERGGGAAPLGVLAPSGWRRRAAEAAAPSGRARPRDGGRSDHAADDAAAAAAARRRRGHRCGVPASERARTTVPGRRARARRSRRGRPRSRRVRVVGTSLWCWRSRPRPGLRPRRACSTGRAARSCGLLAGTLPLETRRSGCRWHSARRGRRDRRRPRPGADFGRPFAGRVAPGAAALALALASLGAWGGFAAAAPFPAAGWAGAAAAGGLALVATPLFPPALAGAAWLAATSPSHRCAAAPRPARGRAHRGQPGGAPPGLGEGVSTCWT